MKDKDNTKKRFKLRYVFVPLIILAILFILFAGYMRIVLFPDGFDMPMDPEISWFGITYYELYSFQSQKEKEVGEEIVERARACMEYTGDEEFATETDALSRFYYFSYRKRPVTTSVDVSLKKAVLHGKKGSVWFRYSFKWFDENGKLTRGSGDVLTRCTIEKDESGKWIVTSVNEPP